MVCEFPGISGSLYKGNSSSNSKDSTGKKVIDVSCLKHTEAGYGFKDSVNVKNVFYFKSVLL